MRKAVAGYLFSSLPNIILLQVGVDESTISEVSAKSTTIHNLLIIYNILLRCKFSHLQNLKQRFDRGGHLIRCSEYVP